MTAKPVFESLSYNQLLQLLESDGIFMILFVGAWCLNTRAVIRLVSAVRLQVPYVFAYNKEWKDAAGNPKPILDQIELMYTWADIQPDIKDDKGVVGDHYKTYTAALDKLFSAFAAKVKK